MSSSPSLVPSERSSTPPEEPSQTVDFFDLEDVRHHWTLLAHCDALLFPNPYPMLSFPSEIASLLWHYQQKSVRPSQAVIRQLAQSAAYTLRKITLTGKQIEQFVMCDTLLDLQWFDHALRKSFLENLIEFLSFQTGLVSVSFENARLQRQEGMQALMAIGHGSAKSLQRIYMWHMFNRDENPILIDTTFCKYRDVGAFKASSTCKISFWRTLLRFPNLTTVAINYSYLADVHGHTLCMLSCVLKGRLQELKLLCEDQDTPQPNLANEFDGQFKIPDTAWQLAMHYCPTLMVHLVFVGVCRYEQVTAFMSQSMPLNKLYLSSGIPSDKSVKEFHVDCVLKTIIAWYSNTLEHVIIHLWHNHELLDGMLLKVLDMPLLVTFEFHGVLYRDCTMEKICHKIAQGDFTNLRRIRVRLQILSKPPSHFEGSRKAQRNLVTQMETFVEKHGHILKERNITMDLGISSI